jgi:hypothetical protein
MRIYLTVKDFGGGPKAFALFTLRSERHHIFGKVEAFIDTGSPDTTLGIKDIKSLHIPTKSLPSEAISYVGGSTTRLHSLGNVTLYFKDEENKPIKINLQKIFVAEPLEHGEKTLNIFSTIPSMIGTDFLLINGFSFYFNPTKRIAYLEKEE